MTTPARPVVLDVDTGLDDAMALLLAVRHPALDVLAVSCAAGNVGVDQVLRNTLKVLDAAGAPGDLPVARGCERPLLEEAREARHVHGEDGLADLGLPESSRRPDRRHAVELMRDAVLGSPRPVTLVPLAPLTNVALLLRTYPEVGRNLERIVLMGGAADVGNATAEAEFNVWHDPEAAAIVLGSEVPTLMYGLDVFYEVSVALPEIQRLTSSADPAARLAGRLLQHQVTRFGPDGATVGDAGAVAAVIDAEGLRTGHHPVRVELAGRFTRGRTVVDRRARAGGQPEAEGEGRSIDVALGVDADRYRRLFLDTLTGA